MTLNSADHSTRDPLAAELKDVQGVVLDALRATSLSGIVDMLRNSVAGGKMLRARLALRVGAATGVARADRLRIAAIVEMIHAASLLHDDVIDHADLRRGVASFWAANGASGAILLGDLLVCRAVRMSCEGNDMATVSAVVSFAEEMCDAESQQELLLRDQTPEWETCVSLARRKTGALFALAAYCCGGTDVRVCAALRESGYEIGTAYQLADDLLDASGDSAAAGKTLGSDAARAKVTAFSSWRRGEVDPRAQIELLCESSSARLEDWPALHAAWQEFMFRDMKPGIQKFVERFSMAVAV